MLAERPPAEVIDQHWSLAVADRIYGTNAPAIDAAAISAHPQAYKLFEARVIQNCKGLHVLVAQHREQRKVAAKDKSFKEDAQREPGETHYDNRSRPPQRFKRAIQEEGPCYWKQDSGQSGYDRAKENLRPPGDATDPGVNAGDEQCGEY